MFYHIQAWCYHQMRKRVLLWCGVAFRERAEARIFSPLLVYFIVNSGLRDSIKSAFTSESRFLIPFVFDNRVLLSKISLSSPTLDLAPSLCSLPPDNLTVFE